MHRVKIGRWFLLLLALSAGGGHADEGLLARYAVLLGPRAAETPDVTKADAQSLLAGPGDVDPKAVQDVLGLTSLRGLQIGTVQLDAAGGRFSATADHADTTVKAGFRMIAGSMDDHAAAQTQIEVWQDGEILFVPTVTSLIGEVAIVTSETDDGRTAVAGASRRRPEQRLACRRLFRAR